VIGRVGCSCPASARAFHPNSVIAAALLAPRSFSLIVSVNLDDLSTFQLYHELYLKSFVGITQNSAMTVRDNEHRCIVQTPETQRRYRPFLRGTIETCDS
jgi:hypothetical protein